MPKEETAVDNNMEDKEPMEELEESGNSGSQKLSKSEILKLSIRYIKLLEGVLEWQTSEQNSRARPV